MALLKKEIKGKFVFEPVGFWENVDGENVFEKFCNDPQTFGFSFQALALGSMFSEQKKMEEEKGIVIFERTPVSSMNVFGKKNFIEGNRMEDS